MSEHRHATRACTACGANCIETFEGAAFFVCYVLIVEHQIVGSYCSTRCLGLEIAQRDRYTIRYIDEPLVHR